MAIFVASNRAWCVLSHVIHVYLETHEPVASQRIAKIMGMSSASMRAVMADLEKAGFLESAHCSAGRIPTAKTLRLYAHNIAHQEQVLSEEDNSALKELEYSCGTMGKISQTLADLCHCAGVFFSVPQDLVLASIQFLPLSPGKFLSIIETLCGKTEYRVISISTQIPENLLLQVSNFLNSVVHGRTVLDAAEYIEKTLDPKDTNQKDSSLDDTTFNPTKKSRPLDQAIRNSDRQDLTQENIPTLALYLLRKGVVPDAGALDIKGHGYLLNEMQDAQGFARFRMLFTWMDKQHTFCEMLHNVILKQQLQIFFGSDDGFSYVHGCSVVVTPYQSEGKKGVVGVIGPIHMDYRRVIPIIDRMAKIVERVFP